MDGSEFSSHILFSLVTLLLGSFSTTSCFPFLSLFLGMWMGRMAVPGRCNRTGTLKLVRRRSEDMYDRYLVDREKDDFHEVGVVQLRRQPYGTGTWNGGTVCCVIYGKPIF